MQRFDMTEERFQNPRAWHRRECVTDNVGQNEITYNAVDTTTTATLRPTSDIFEFCCPLRIRLSCGARAAGAAGSISGKGDDRVVDGQLLPMNNGRSLAVGSPGLAGVGSDRRIVTHAKPD